MKFNIRQETTGDHPAVYALTRAAFDGTEHCDGDEQDLVVRLRGSQAFIPELSLVAETAGKLIGHILFVRITIGGGDALMMAILSVLPQYQKQGGGGSLIARGHAAALQMGFPLSLLIGHPGFYPRFGYERASKYAVTQPFPAPDECVTVKILREDGKVLAGQAAFPLEFY
ncbi:MAG: N-acetyltransferase [Oscillospiraceae bacterium]|nr:N-acetyltransferase [Oscillospiraceae bacterium]